MGGAFCKKGREVRQPKFVKGERQAQIGLREGGDRASEGGGHGERSVRVGVDWNEGAFVEINGQTGGDGEIIKKGLEIGNVRRNGPNDDKSIVCILKDRTWEVVNNRVKKEAGSGSMQDKLLKDVDDDVEEEGG